MFDDTQYFECQCSSAEHALVFTLDQEESEIYTEVFLNNYRPWWKRVGVAVKYVFGYKCKYGHFDCFLMQNKDADRLITMLKKIT